MPSCAAYGCTQRQQENGISLHRFPKDPTQRQKWIDAVRRKDFVPSKSAVLCSKHFKEEDIDKTSLSCVRIRNNAVPSLFEFEAFPEYLQKKQIIHITSFGHNGSPSYRHDVSNPDWVPNLRLGYEHANPIKSQDAFAGRKQRKQLATDQCVESKMAKKTAQDVSALVKTFADITEPMTNGCVYRLFIDNHKNQAKTWALLDELKKLPPPKDANHLRQIKQSITSVSQNMDKLKNKPDRRWNDIVNFLNQPFKSPIRDDKAKASTTPLSVSISYQNNEANKSTNSSWDPTLSLNLEVFEEEEPSLPSKDEDNFIDINTSQSFHSGQGAVLAPSTSLVKRVKCEGCRLKRKSISDLQHKVRVMKNRNRYLKHLMAKDNNKKRQLVRKDASIRLWKRKYIEEKKKTKIWIKPEPSEMNEVRILKMRKTKLQQKIRNLERDNRNDLIKLKEEIRNMNLLMKKKDEEMKSLTIENHNLISRLLDNETTERKTLHDSSTV